MNLWLHVRCHSNSCQASYISHTKYHNFYKLLEYFNFYILKIITCGVIERNSDHGIFLVNSFIKNEN